MADGDPWYIQLLDRLGVNTTRLRWRLYQRQKQADRIMEEGVRPSSIIPWWSYANKVCPHCRALNNHDATECNSCSKRLPSMFMYRVRRLIVGSVPKEGAVVSIAFLGLMLLMYGLQIVLEDRGIRGLVSPTGDGAEILGILFRPWVEQEGEYWRLLAFGLVHGGLLHIGFNSYALAQVGPLIESQLERGRMLTLVTATQLTSAAACWIFSPGNPVLGASGWIFGLIGYGIVFAHRAGISEIRDALIRWAVFVLLFGLVVGGISNAAHIGGLAGGLAFGTLPEPRIRSDSISGKVWTAAGALSAVLWAVTLAFMAWSVKTHWAELQSM